MKFEETRPKKITPENVDMAKLLFNLKPECKQKAKETHTHLSKQVSPQRLVPPAAEIKNLTPQTTPVPCVLPQRLVPPAAEINNVTPKTPPAPCVLPQRLVPPAAEIKNVTPPAPCVSPQRLVPSSPAAKNQAIQPQSPPVSPQRSVPSSPPVSPVTSLHSSPAQLSSNDTEDVLSPHEDGYNMYKNQPVVLLHHLTVKSAPHRTSAPRSAPHSTLAPRSAPHSTSTPRSAPHSTSAPRSAPHSTSKTGKSRCIKKCNLSSMPQEICFQGQSH